MTPALAELISSVTEAANRMGAVSKALTLFSNDAARRGFIAFAVRRGVLTDDEATLLLQNEGLAA